jgi:hypothetical protein
VCDTRGEEPTTALPEPAVDKAAGERRREQVPRGERVVPDVCDRERTGLEDDCGPLAVSVGEFGLEEPSEQRLFLEGRHCEPEHEQEKYPDWRGRLRDRRIRRARTQQRLESNSHSCCHDECEDEPGDTPQEVPSQVLAVDPPRGEVEYRRGVFFQQKTTVPYNRITNVGISQGPIERFVNAGAVGIHTAGYGGQMGAELTIGGVSDFKGIQEQILDRVRERPAKATEGEDTVETFESRTIEGEESTEMLGELRRIRELLEQGRTA